MRWLIVLAIVVGLIYFLWPEQPAKIILNSVTAPPPASALPTVAPTPDANLIDRLNQAAREVGVQLRGVEPQPGGWGLLSIAWTGSNAALGGDYLDRCRREGLIRDFDVEGRYGQATENNQRVFLAQFKVQF